MQGYNACPFSGSPKDLWEHYFKKLLESEADIENQELVLDLATRYGTDWVWEHRRRLLELMRYFVIDFAGTDLKVAAC